MVFVLFSIAYHQSDSVTSFFIRDGEVRGSYSSISIIAFFAIVYSIKFLVYDETIRRPCFMCFPLCLLCVLVKLMHCVERWNLVLMI